MEAGEAKASAPGVHFQRMEERMNLEMGEEEQNTIEGKGLEGLDTKGKASHSVQVQLKASREFLRQAIPFQVKEESEEIQSWEAQLQDFLMRMEVPLSARGIPPLMEESTPWNDAKTFLASFEQVAEACQWSKEEWVTRLLPALSGEAEQAFSRLEAADKKDYGKVKAAILREDAISGEKIRQHFRRFCYQEAEGPRGAYTQLQELCRRWLKFDRRSKEQILEAVILEQFLTILPQGIQSWVRECSPETCSQAVALAEDFLLSHQEAQRPENQVLEPFKVETVSFPAEEQVPMGTGQSWVCQDSEPEGNPENAGSSPAYIQATEYWEENHQWERSGQVKPKEMPRRRATEKKSRGDAPKHQHRLRRQRGTPSGEKANKACPVVCKKQPPFWQTQKICTVCGKVFKWTSELIRHHRSHTGEKPYGCSVCEKRFTHNSHLNQHLKKVHMKEKPFVCSACGKSFCRNSDMLQHQKAHKRDRT